MKIRSLALHMIALAVAVIPLVPLVLLLALAFSESQVDIRGFTLRNFDFLRNGVLFAEDPVYSKLYPNVYTVAFNTFLLALGNMLIVVLISSMAGYIISRYSFKGRSALLGSFLVIHGVPASVLLIALYYMLKSMGLLNTLLGVVLVKVAVDLPLGVWVLKGFYDSIPWDIEIASLVDGSSRLGAFFRVMLPLVKPGIFAVGLFSFLSGWGEYIFVYTFIQSSTNWTFSLLIRSLIGEMGGINLALIAALSIIYLIPVIVIFVVGEKYLVRVTVGGVKG
ncbi:carbohydrate ABC transporter permease [Thermofilum pendens]|uniref:Binding-protein-dependent transport systems inner membrane component n=1 Tax=Thermofilum pendens (strain DSM 2475 / Hrk 5) TaxID=368408 RepID=A1RZE4_THEPD|nr:carbohydrate ABC transporter permease [Thermofilum pendens]ABL78574.1 binding-protein-dependent transport systems inner membrane component [Thermofilum pendens Hrk 5]